MGQCCSKEKDDTKAKTNKLDSKLNLSIVEPNDEIRPENFEVSYERLIPMDSIMENKGLLQDNKSHIMVSSSKSNWIIEVILLQIN